MATADQVRPAHEEHAAAYEGFGQLPADAPPHAVDYNPEQDEYWVRCRQGHVHWGARGAAGVLMRHTDGQGQRRFFLQKRSAWVDHGGTYSVPGGAIDDGELPQDAARREMCEEMGRIPAMEHSHTHVDEHGDWAYHTVVADVEHQLTPDGDGGSEHAGGGWFTPEEMRHLPLHPGFRATWDKVGDQESNGCP